MKKDYKTYLREGVLMDLKGKIKTLYLLPAKKNGAMITIHAYSEEKLNETLYNLIEENKNIVLKNK